MALAACIWRDADLRKTAHMPHEAVLTRVIYYISTHFQAIEIQKTQDLAASLSMSPVPSRMGHQANISDPTTGRDITNAPVVY